MKVLYSTPRSYMLAKKGFLIVNCSLFLVYVIIFTGNEINPKAFVRSKEQQEEACRRPVLFSFQCSCLP